MPPSLRTITSFIIFAHTQEEVRLNPGDEFNQINVRKITATQSYNVNKYVLVGAAQAHVYNSINTFK